MDMKILYHIDKNKWAQFVTQHPEGNVFQLPMFFDIYKGTPKYKPVFLSVVDDTEEILGVLLAVVQREHKGFLGKFSARSIIWEANY